MFKKMIGLISKFNKSSNIINNIDKLLDFKTRASHLLNLALTSSEPITRSNEAGETELIVSFTTYSKRIYDVHLVIESIALQTKKPNRVILWLDESEFNFENIPIILKKQVLRGLEIRFCPNYRSYKKLVPALNSFPNANIITIDDDIIYPHDMVELLMLEHQSYPEFVLGHRVHKLKVKNKKILPYSHWDHNIESDISGFNIVPTGAGGVLYPQGSLALDCTNVDEFSEVAPNADDIWFKAMSLLNSRQCKKVGGNRNYTSYFVPILNSQDIGLYNDNVNEGGNDFQIQKTFEKYKQLIEKLT